LLLEELMHRKRQAVFHSLYPFFLPPNISIINHFCVFPHLAPIIY
jgi:hypothetical protein